MAKKGQKSRSKKTTANKASDRTNKTASPTTTSKDAALSSAFRLFKQTIIFCKQHWRPLSWLGLVYLLLQLLLVRSASTSSFNQIRADVNEQLGESILSAPVTAGVALSVGSQSSELASLYGMLLFMVFSLAAIWMIRRLMVGQKFKYRAALYKGMYPLIPFLLLCGLLLLQLVPFLVGALIYSFVTLGGIAASGLETAFFIGLWVLLAAASAYMISVTTMALYAVTLPDMEPMQALRAVKRVVGGVRWQIVSRLISLALLLVVFNISAVLLVIVFTTAGAFVAIDVLAVISVLFTHVYMFQIYKELV